LNPGLHSAEFRCVIRVEDLSVTGGFRNTSAKLHFTGTAISKNGSIRSFQRRIKGAGQGEVQFDCQIPATPEAGDLMDRYFASIVGRGSRGGRSSPDW
jgi:hypothetical protein